MGADKTSTWRWRAGAVALVLLTTLAMVLLSIVLARQQARSDQAKRAATYALDVLHRSEQTGDQIATAFRELAAAGVGADSPCDYATREHLQRFDATSSYIQMIGILQGDAIACSSYGWHGTPVDLGPVDYVSSTNTQIRRDVRLRFAPAVPFTVISDGRFAALIHRSLPVDASVTESGVSLSLLTASRRATLAQRGDFREAWIPDEDRLPPGGRRTIRIGDHVVSQARSARYDIVAIAALDAVHYQSVFYRFARVLVPFGLVVGLALGWLLLRVARAQSSLGAAIRGALRADQFFIVLQPIVDLSTRRWVGAEVLLRWQRADGQLVRPDLFIPVAEENGTIIDITQRVLAKAEPVLAELAKRTDGMFLSINLSPQDLLFDQTAVRLKRLLARAGAQPQQLHVEITERGFANTEAARERIAQLRATGLCVSIDDFGTGYSSLSELVNFELDTLKIDKTFVDTIGGEQVTSHVAYHIVELARSLKLETVAEGIETEAQAETLQQWGVKHGQGWLFSKPLTPDAFLRALPPGAAG